MKLEFPACRGVSYEEITQLASRFCYIEQKFDGARYVVTTSPFSVMSRRRVNQAEKLSYLEELEKVFPNSILDGELWVPDEDNVSAVAHYAAKAVATESFLSGKLVYVIFDIQRFCAADCMGIPQALRRCTLEGAFEECHIPGVVLSEVYPRLPSTQIMKKWEGIVVKNPEVAFEWYKWKSVETYDCIITGLKEGGGKYIGTLGALLVSQYNEDGELVEVASASGMTDEERHYFWLEVPKWLDREEQIVVEVMAQERTIHGRLRHPRYVRIREDKPPQECKI